MLLFDYKRCAKIWILVPSLFALLLAVGCTGNEETAYARHEAFLRVPTVSVIHPLHSALNSPGVFCEVSFSTTHYYFKNNHGQSASMLRTALDAYGKPLYVSGFIIGTPNGILTESGDMRPVAFDAVCPTCFNAALIQRKLTIDEDGFAHCSRCQTVYNLNNGGFPQSSTGKADKMLQYHLRYANDILVVSN
jgi:hypothetical protein